MVSHIFNKGLPGEQHPQNSYTKHFSVFLNLGFIKLKQPVKYVTTITATLSIKSNCCLEKRTSWVCIDLGVLCYGGCTQHVGLQDHA